MSAPGWDYQHPTTPETAQTPIGHASEPSGYNLGDLTYVQPPSSPWPAPYTLAPLPSGQATAGFVVSLSCLVSMWILPILITPGLIVGVVLSARALKACRRGLASGRGLAIAGLVLGIVGLALTAVLIVLFILFLTVMRLNY